MPEHENPNVADKLEAIIANPTTRSAIASIIASPRPAGWGRKSNASYFKKSYADLLLPYIDQQIESKKDLILRYNIWCTKLRISEKTLYTLCNQAILFIIERLDPTGKYATWYETVDIDSKTSQMGILFSIARAEAAKNLKAEVIEPADTLPQWRNQLADWLESGSEEPFVKECLTLSPEEIAKLREEFMGNDGLMVSIKSNSIRIVKV